MSTTIGARDKHGSMSISGVDKHHRKPAQRANWARENQEVL